MAWNFGWEPAREISTTDWMIPYLGTLAMDPCDAVRFMALRSLHRFKFNELLGQRNYRPVTLHE